jgi:hypothetical protein
VRAILATPARRITQTQGQRDSCAGGNNKAGSGSCNFGVIGELARVTREEIADVFKIPCGAKEAAEKGDVSP